MVEDADFGPIGRRRCDGDQAIVKLSIRTADQSSLKPSGDVDHEVAETVFVAQCF